VVESKQTGHIKGGWFIVSENLMNSDHKATNQKFRDGYDGIFRKNKFRNIEFTLKKVDGDLRITDYEECMTREAENK